MRGVTAPNDGQQGTFYWNGTSTTPGDNVDGLGPVNTVDPYNGRGPAGRWLRDTTGAGSGSVTQISAGTGITLTPSPITLTGVVNLAPINANTLLANITGSPNPPSPVSISQVIDNAIGSTPGAILYRAAGGWTIQTPGASGTVLTISSGVPNWVAGGTGTVMSVTAGSGLTGGTITVAGNIALGPIAQNTILANTSAGTNTPSPTGLSALLDSTFGNQTGNVLYRSGVSWVALSLGVAGQVLTVASGGPVWATTGTGSVSTVNTGTGLTGGPITSTGTIQLASIVTNTVLANTGAAATAPTPTTPSAILDNSFGASTGLILYRATGSWTSLSLGTSGQVLTAATSGVPVWGTAGIGSVTAITAGSGLTAVGITSGIISTAGTITLAAIPGYTVLANTSGTTQDPFATTISAVLDAMVITATSGAMIYRAAGSWTELPIGSSGQVMTTGTSGYPVWATTTGTGTVTSVALAVPPIFGVSGSPVTTNGTIGVSVVAQGSGVFWAGSSGSAVTTTPSFRQLVSSDFPVSPTFQGTLSTNLLNASGNSTLTGQVTIGSSATFAGYVTFDGGLNVNVKSITSSANSYTINPNVDYLIVVNQASSVAISINLPSSPLSGDTYAIKDGKGVAATFGITIVATSGTIDGNTSVSMNTNFQSVSVTAINDGGPWVAT